MATFKCLKSKTVVSANSGVDLGSSTTSTYTLGNTPIVAGSLNGTIFRANVAIQTFTVDANGAFTFHVVTTTPTVYVTAGSINLNTGVLTFTWNTAPGTNFALVNYNGLPVYTNTTMRLFQVNCSGLNLLCNNRSEAYVPAVTVCDQSLF